MTDGRKLDDEHGHETPDPFAWDAADERSLKPIYFHLDGPTEGQVVPRYPVVVSGWTFDPEQPWLAVPVTVEGRIWAGTRSLNRPDVAQAHPDLPAAEAAGWRAEIDLGRWPKDTALISVVVLRRNRTWGVADRRTVRLRADWQKDPSPKSLRIGR
jgi:hypothetical protein